MRELRRSDSVSLSGPPASFSSAADAADGESSPPAERVHAPMERLPTRAYSAPVDARSHAAVLERTTSASSTPRGGAHQDSSAAGVPRVVLKMASGGKRSLGSIVAGGKAAGDAAGNEAGASPLTCGKRQQNKKPWT